MLIQTSPRDIRLNAIVTQFKRSKKKKLHAVELATLLNLEAIDCSVRTVQRDLKIIFDMNVLDCVGSSMTKFYFLKGGEI